MLRTALTATFMAATSVAALAEPAYQDRICIIWADNGHQLVGAPCVLQVWNVRGEGDMYRFTDQQSYELTLTDGNPNDTEWTLTGRYRDMPVNSPVFVDAEGYFHWPNGNYAVSIEEYEGD